MWIRYFFTFTDGAARATETYTRKEKSEWFVHLQTYYARTQTVSQKDRPVHIIGTDFGAELRSNAIDQWILAKRILFEPSAPYSQEENGIRAEGLLMERVRSTIIAEGIPDELWPEVLLAMTHVSNLLPTTALNGRSLFEASTQSLPNLQHLRVLGSTVYVFIHEEERKAKSAKWEARGNKGMLLGYDGHTIYRVYLPDEEKIIRIKDLRIEENADGKADSHVTSYDAITASQGDITSNTPPPMPRSETLLNPTPPFPYAEPSSASYTQTRSGRISKPPKRYDVGMNNDVQVLLSQLTVRGRDGNWNWT